VISPFQKALKAKEQAGTWRGLTLSPGADVDFTSNDYLTLSRHPLVIQAAIEAVQSEGTGATGARLLSGNSRRFEALELDLARLKGTEAALVFNSGFQANLTMLATLLSPSFYDHPPIVFADRLNHASLHQGCQLAGVRQHRYQHLDYAHLETLIKKHAKPGHPHFILTESVFGMEGDIADLGTLCDVAETIGAHVYVDEAHATGVFGQEGSGLTKPHASRLGAVMGTFSKALGGFGGYFAGSQELKEFFINFAPGFIYSTALPPATVAANHQAIKLLPFLTPERLHLHRLAAHARQRLSELGFDIGRSESHLIPLLIGDINQAIALHQTLKKSGLLTSLIRPPTVPPTGSRLRLALQACHHLDDMDRLVESLSQTRRSA
jgi:8-amino-7-oxononanoate synthase